MISYLANPLRFQKFAAIATPIFGGLALMCIVAGVWQGLWISPQDERHGESVRIMYVHVPAAVSAMMAYGAMAFASMVAYIWRHPLADELAKACALPGAMFTALALLSGSLWGVTSWGTYWQWDGRMTSVLILLFLFIGYMSIWSLTPDKKKAARLAGVLAMVGAINLPIIKFSVNWWNSLHQTETISAPGAPGLAPEMLLPFGLMYVGYIAFFSWLVLCRVQNEIASAQRLRQSRPAAKPAQAKLEDI